MSWGVYLMPITTSGVHRGPKYLKWRFNPTGLDVPWGMMDYGFEPIALVAADLTDTQRTNLLLNADVDGFPMDLTTKPSSQQANTLEDKVESLMIPGNWIGPNQTYKEIVHTIAACFQFAQRVHATLGNVSMFGSGITLNSKISSMTTERQQAFQAAADSLGYSTAGIGANTTVRQGYKIMADQWNKGEINLGGIKV